MDIILIYTAMETPDHLPKCVFTRVTYSDQSC